MSAGIRHPYSGALYEKDDDGLVVVTAADGRRGRFHGDGRWVDGDLGDADPQMCGWVAGPRIANHRVGSAPPA